MTSTEILKPTSMESRLQSMDIIRGVALLGILLMNITEMGLSHAYSDPTISGGYTGWNLVVWWMNSMFFEGTMRGMFSMLFGAGVILFTSRSERTTDGISVTDAYFRRVIWLILFGMFQAYVLLWEGDILYAYGIIGLFMYSFRNLAPRKLVLFCVLALGISTLLNVKEYVEKKGQSDKSAAAIVKRDAGEILTKEDSAAISTWEGVVKREKPSQEEVDEDIAARIHGYLKAMDYKSGIVATMESRVMYRFFFLDIFGMMLLGMAFFKNGILKAARSYSYYAILLVAGYGIGLTTNYLETTYMIAKDFEPVALSLAGITYDLGRVFTTIGHVALIMLFVKSGILPWLQQSLGAVGKMAFTNYICHSVMALFVFVIFGKYGAFQRYELYYIVGSVWIVQLIISPIWLKYFRFGPLEWCWRSLTYWERQPFRK